MSNFGILDDLIYNLRDALAAHDSADLDLHNQAADEIERLRERNHVLKDALQSLCYRWDEVLNNFYDGEEENDAREKARKALGGE